MATTQTSTFKRGTPVVFRTRQDRPQMTGKVTGRYGTTRGQFVIVKGDDGQVRNVRPAYLQLAT